MGFPKGRAKVCVLDTRGIKEKFCTWLDIGGIKEMVGMKKK